MVQKKSISFLKASVIQFASKYLNVAIQLILTAILARLLSPEEYGVMAGITIFTSLFSILADMGFGPAIIQFKDLTQKDYGGIFVFSIAIGAVLSIAFALLGYPISWFFHDDSYKYLCVLAVTSIFFNAVNMVPNGLLLKDKKFVSIGIRLIVSTMVGGAVAIILAYSGLGTAALVWNLNVVAVLVFAWNYITIRAQLSFRGMHILQSVRKVLRYSLYQAGFSIVNYFSRNTDHLIIGRFFGSVPLGLYDKAYKLTSYPIQFVPGILGTVLQPYLSAYQNDKEKLFRYQMLLVRFLALAGSLFMFICVLCGEDIVNIMYGAQWGSCVPLFLILSCSIAFQMVMNVTGGILQSAGRTDLLFRQGLLATGAMLLMVFVGAATHNLRVLTICVSVAFFVQLFTVAYYTAVKAFNHSLFDFLFPVIRIVGISTLIAIPEMLLRYRMCLSFGNDLVDLIVYSTVYAVLFIVVFLIVGDLRQLVHAIRKKV
ncbi:lipopolysaccharide biosynthesis protein [Bifidobacterium pseudolongum]|uniref:lipopolysaccharide biosynthesis protein n=1 Tax=Bifidobacterium pseudolongum TaxID=1694 RepID=UPI0013EADE24|nr:lipopolysaccharide biosynthesis protein [Bifidobacterium pseudolongum]